MLAKANSNMRPHGIQQRNTMPTIRNIIVNNQVDNGHSRRPEVVRYVLRIALPGLQLCLAELGEDSIIWPGTVWGLMAYLTDGALLVNHALGRAAELIRVLQLAHSREVWVFEDINALLNCIRSFKVNDITVLRTVQPLVLISAEFLKHGN